MNRNVIKLYFWRLLCIIVVLALTVSNGIPNLTAVAQAPLARIVASESGDWFWTADFIPGDLAAAIYDF